MKKKRQTKNKTSKEIAASGFALAEMIRTYFNKEGWGTYDALRLCECAYLFVFAEVARRTPTNKHALLKAEALERFLRVLDESFKLPKIREDKK